jgi:glycosyltransferase involved in cell wall biosynthesis
MTATPTAVAVCVCTYRRNELLARLLDRVAEISGAAGERYRIGVVVVDDNPGGTAEPVLDAYRDVFPLGVHYRRSGQQNISVGRNLALEAGAAFGDVIAMTDDDCRPEPSWIDELLAAREATGADAVSGPLLTELPPDAPRWIVEQGVYDDVHDPVADLADLPIGQTNNCLLDVAWLRAHPEHRFDPHYGRIGGEDMVFFSGAVGLGMRSVHAARAVVHQLEPLSDLRYRTMLRARFWWGNSEAVTNLANGTAGRRRLALRGLRRSLQSLLRPISRLARRRPPHVRAAVVDAAHGAGLVAGACGLRLRHH